METTHFTISSDVQLFYFLLLFLPRCALFTTASTTAIGDEVDQINANAARFQQCCRGIVGLPTQMHDYLCDYENLIHVFMVATDMRMMRVIDPTGLQQTPLPHAIIAALDEPRLRRDYFRCLTNGEDHTECCELLQQDEGEGIRKRCLPWCNGTAVATFGHIDWISCNSNQEDFVSLVGIFVCHFTYGMLHKQTQQHSKAET